MILQDASLLADGDHRAYAWSSLRNFHHTPSTVERIMHLHSLPVKHRDNVKKQAAQIRQCLIQAREYREAASAVSLATKPLLLYYSLMSLALAQILYKGTGADSLDKARGEHAHHGLNFHAASLSKDKYDLASTAAALVARPMIKDGRRRGTFELWHRTAREDPLTGRHDIPNGYGLEFNEVQVFFSSGDLRLGEIATNGMTFLECLKGTPGMARSIYQFGLQTDIISARISGSSDGNDGRLMEMLVQPQTPAAIDAFMNEIILKPSAVNNIVVNEISSDFHFRYEFSADDVGFINFPKGAMWNSNEIRFIPSSSALNEFGYLYIGLYILGNYARYFPDKWISDVEDGSPHA